MEASISLVEDARQRRRPAAVWEMPDHNRRQNMRSSIVLIAATAAVSAAVQAGRVALLSKDKLAM